MRSWLPAAVVRSAVLVAGLVGCVAIVVAVFEVLAHALSGGGAGTWTWFGAAVVLAVVVPLVRPALERVADTAAFGRSGDPHAILAGFAQRISDTLAIDDVLPQLARTAVQATHSSSGGVRLWLTDGGERYETWPPGVPAEPGQVSLLLVHGGNPIGRLEVAAADEGQREVDRQLLSRLAGPAGLALANVRLTLELRRRLAQTMALAESIEQSRQRMLDTAREQRERFVVAVRERVLSRLDAAENRISQAAAGTPGALEAAELETRACLEALRDLAAGVFPPTLADHGLGPALEWQALRVDGVVSVHDAANGHRYPPFVEAAGYFCCAALTDDVEAGERLDLELSGDATTLRFVARGTSPVSPAVHQLMLDRVEALGGRLEISTDDAEVAVHGELPTEEVSMSTLVDRLLEPVSDADPDPDRPRS